MKKSFYQIMLWNCDEATLKSTQAQYEKLNFFQRIRLWIHNKTCPPCEDYHNQNSIMTDMFEKLRHDRKHYDVESLKNKIKGKLTS